MVTIVGALKTELSLQEFPAVQVFVGAKTEETADAEEEV